MERAMALTVTTSTGLGSRKLYWPQMPHMIGRLDQSALPAKVARLRDSLNGGWSVWVGAISFAAAGSAPVAARRKHRLLNIWACAQRCIGTLSHPTSSRRERSDQSGLRHFSSK